LTYFLPSGYPETMPPPLSIRLDDASLRQALASRSVVCLTGAGISAESGIPTFRGADGLWQKFRPEELASIDAFLANPELVWEWYRFRRDKMSSALPNAGHHALASWQQKVDGFHLITQNVDGLHQKAGSRDLVELHGNIWRDACLDCGARFEASIPFESELPRCECGGRLRPDVVWFGEFLPEAALEQAYAWATECEVFLSVGTSALVQPAAGLPLIAKRNGARLIEINPEPTPLSPLADYTFFAAAGDVLPRFLEAVT
jgi:NAD-dependent deacetylase